MNQVNVNSKKNIVIAGGGTGGHIYPGVAIAKALQQIDPQVQIHFVGTPSGLETKIIPREGFPLHLISVGKLNQSGSFLSPLKTLIGLPLAFLKCIKLLLELKPVAVLGVGGYASGPFVLMASFLGPFLNCKTMIWEPNAYPGMTNRWLSRFVQRCFVVFNESKIFLKSKNIDQVGLPVRKELENIGQLKVSVAQEPNKDFKILIFGGSQGARAINKVVSATILESLQKNNPSSLHWLENVKIIHQTGPHDFEEISQQYQNLPAPFKDNILAQAFIYDMDVKYQWADLVICRSGASTVAELAACAKPSVLIPLPTAADDHQKKNALALADKHAAILLEQKLLNAENLIQFVDDLKINIQKRAEMMTQVHTFFVPQAAETIAHKILE
jgi:UDP-N-acetylglucosamine--N-acetylmuramyl-(pentapeptide) pyrophosphoryl-undecaprenol N-acetylglucosamine transferase